ncbi:PREDICTED: meiosis-specific protein MEI4-like [Cyprinodon variegatus]|uniref:meiosis-specific protein MEI4-like n=1 Tax=Cyprinodon variegatus TaxID=28743 RepID=UPI0007425CAD|nr:PREDICTED: meiosis-specific protein MEI4-like [Cyprinodon variegatus]
METEPNLLNGSSPASWLLLKARVAAAVAVIRSRRPGLSGRQHAEALGRRLRRREEAWKERAQALQQEVLRLRQELLVSRATLNTRSHVEAAGDAILDAVSQDLIAPASDSLTPELMLQDAPPPPPKPRGPQTDALRPHMHFLLSLLSLHRLDASSSGVEALCWPAEGGGASAVAETLCVLLDSVVTVFKEPPALGLADPAPQACQVASRALDLLCSLRRPSVDFMRRVEEAMRELTQMLLHSKHPSRVSNVCTHQMPPNDRRCGGPEHSRWS